MCFMTFVSQQSCGVTIIAITSLTCHMRKQTQKGWVLCVWSQTHQWQSCQQNSLMLLALVHYSLHRKVTIKSSFQVGYTVGKGTPLLKLISTCTCTYLSEATQSNPAITKLSKANQSLFLRQCRFCFPCNHLEVL